MIEPSAAETHDGRTNKWLGLVAASTGLFLGSLDITVNVALPDITSSFGTDVQTIQWIIIFYVGSTTGLQLSLGSAADIYGLKRFFIIGIGTYTLAVLLIGLAPTLSVIFGLRVLQAVGNGLMLASAPALVTAAFPPEERGKALGLMAALGTLGMITGSLGGGVLVDSFGWRSIFLARIPLAVLAAVFAFLALQERKAAEPRPSFDYRGAVAVFVGLTSLILSLTLGGRNGWTTVPVLLLALLSVASLSGFVYLERNAARPVLALGLLRNRVLSPAMIAAYLVSMAVFVNWFILPFYVADILGVNAKSLGLLLMLTPLVSAGVSPIGGWLSDHISPAYPITAALVLSAGAMFWFSSLGIDSTVGDVALRMAATGVGMGLFQAANGNLIMGTVPGNMLGTGGAFMALSRSLGTVCSVAIMSAFFAARLDSHTAALVGQSIAGDSGETQAFVLAFKDTYRVAAVLSVIAALISVALWPQVVRRRITFRRSRQTSA